MTGVVLSLVVALAIFAVGFMYASERPIEWTADSHHLMAPSVQDEEFETATLYDTLGGGQLPATAATILAEDSLLEDVAQELGVEPNEVTTRVTVVPETAVVRVEVTAPDAETAEALADALPEAGEETVAELLSPYRLTSLGSATGTAEKSSMSMPQWLGLLGVAALVAGLAVQQAFQQLARARVRKT